MPRSGFSGRRTSVVGSLVLGLALTGCGGTRESREAIETAAGVGAGAMQVPGAGVPGTAAATIPDGGVPAAAPGATPITPGAATLDPGLAAPAGPPATNAGPKKEPQKAATGVGAAPAAAGPVTRKSVIKLGVVGTFGGPVGGFVKATVTGIRAWSQAINAAGGVNGHPIEVLVGDDGGDPARFNSTLQQFVEQQGVLAILFTTLSFAPNGNNKYLDSKKIYTFGIDGGLETPYTNPYVLGPAPSGFSYADVMLLALGNAMNAKGGVKLASFACSDFGLCDNFDTRWSQKAALDKAGFELVARGRPSLTQPDYTSQCLAAKQAGAEAVILGIDGASVRRFASDCARQNYKPKIGGADLVITADLLGDKNLEGLVVGTKLAPFPDARVPGIREALAAFAKYAPGQVPTGGMAYGWLIGELFAQAGKNLPDNPTQKDLEAGLATIKNNNLKGMTYPMTIRPGKPAERQLCYGTVVVQGGKFLPSPGESFGCVKDGKPMISPDDFGASVGSVERGAPSRAALRAPTALPAPASVPSDPWLGQWGAPVVGVIPAHPRPPAAARSTTRSPRPATCPPSRVAGFSYVFDALRTGLFAGPGVGYGVLLAALGTPLPEPLGQYQAQGIAQGSQSVEQFSKDAPAAIDAARTYFEPLAAYNDYGNALLDAGVDVLNDTADNFGTFIQPGDSSLRQTADSLKDAKATQTPC